MRTNWQQLLCPFFSKISKKVIEGYFQGHGFQVNETETGGLFFQKEDIFVEISYDPQTHPNYSPTLIIGIGMEKFDSSGDPSGVPLWYVLPEESEQRRYSFWKFKSEQDLEIIMDKVLSQIIRPYMEPLWGNLSLLESKVMNFKSCI